MDPKSARQIKLDKSILSKFYGGDRSNRHAKRILGVLASTLKVRTGQFSSLNIEKKTGNAFRTLVVTVLSQNSTDTGALKAYENLERTLGGVSPEKLAKASLPSIRNAIKVGGLQGQKAKGLKKIADIITKKYDGHMEQILEEPLDEARAILMDLPQVGPKTADVLLVTSAGKPTIPIDTHCDRVSRRLGLAPLKGGYEVVRHSLQDLYPPRKYHQVHLLLIAHGRTYCTALRPKCSVCPVREYCPYPNKPPGPVSSVGN